MHRQYCLTTFNVHGFNIIPFYTDNATAFIPQLYLHLTPRLNSPHCISGHDGNMDDHECGYCTEDDEILMVLVKVPK